MSFLEALGLDLAKDVGKKLIDAIVKSHQEQPLDTSVKSRKELAVDSAPPDFEARIAEHLGFVARITERVEFFGLAEAKQTDRDTIDLFMSLPRKFAGARSQKQISEAALLRRLRNYVLLGAPGSGKTTTIKRLARHILTKAPASERDQAQYPLVIRLRTLTGEQGLIDSIGFIYGLAEQRTWSRRERESFARTQERRARAIGFIADTTGALFLLDGLDEVDKSLRDIVENEITLLAESCDVARMIVTCRSGDYNAQLSHFDVLELAPLESHQIELIARRWTREPAEFLRGVRGQPFFDLTTRPLFLCQLLTIFEQTGTIPDQPTDVVERVVRLALEEWDERHKKQPRRSRYAAFDTARKRDFLANLAFWFMYVNPQEQLNRVLLEMAYAEIHERFGLPSDDATLVARELETHTGIFVEVGTAFEFSHLSLQEFLAANYLVRQPISRRFIQYLSAKAAPLAIAVALSTTPETWFAQLLLTDQALQTVRPDTWRSFCSRLLQERPAFVHGVTLGFACIALAMLGPSKDEFVRRFLTQPVTQRSIKLAAAYYRLKRHEGACGVVLRDDLHIPADPAPLREIWIGCGALDELDKSGLLRRADLSS